WRTSKPVRASGSRRRPRCSSTGASSKVPSTAPTSTTPSSSSATPSRTRRTARADGRDRSDAPPHAASRLSRWLPGAVWASLVSVRASGWCTGEQTGALRLPSLAVLFPNASMAELRAIHFTIRKLAHFGEYLVLSILLYRALRAGRRWDLRAAVVSLAVAG